MTAEEVTEIKQIITQLDNMFILCCYHIRSLKSVKLSEDEGNEKEISHAYI